MIFTVLSSKSAAAGAVAIGLQSKFETVSMKKASAKLFKAALIQLKGQCKAVAPLERLMKRFVIRQNIEHYRAMLIVTTDPAQRVQIEGLLHEEEAKLKKYDDDNKKTPGSSKTA